MIWTFRPYGDQFGIPGYFEADTLGELKHGVRQWSPSSTQFKAKAIGYNKWAVISLSPYFIGPALVGYISNSEAIL